MGWNNFTGVLCTRYNKISQKCHKSDSLKSLQAIVPVGFCWKLHSLSWDDVCEILIVLN